MAQMFRGSLALQCTRELQIDFPQVYGREIITNCKRARKAKSKVIRRKLRMPW